MHRSVIWSPAMAVAQSRRTRGLLLAVVALAVTACSKKSEDAPTPAAIPTAAATAPALQRPSGQPGAAESAAAPQEPPFGSAARAAGITGTLTITPVPVPICPKTGLGKTSLKWEASGVPIIEIRVSAPDGALLARAGAKGTTNTGDWVKKDSVFYLQDGSEGVPRNLDHTIAKAEVTETVDGPCK